MVTARAARQTAANLHVANREPLSMARLDRARLAAGIYPCRFEVATRFSDLDVQMHVNNVAVAGIVQEGRARFSAENKLAAFVRDRSVMVASLTIEYADEMGHPAPVEVSVGVIEIGRTSYRLGQVLRQSGVIGAYAEIVMVAGKDGAPTPLDDAWRGKLESLKIK